MALIICPECSKEVSDKATICPNCGYPIIQEDTNINSELSPVNIDDNNKLVIKCPQEFPADLRIGQQITNWKFDAALEGIYSQRENTITNIPSGKVQILLHTHGIRIFSGLNSYDIHNSQIISIEKTTSAQIAQINKSVIGRAIVGNLIMGPLGAIVGGMSGLGTKDKLQVRQYVVVNFWSVENRTAQSILVQCDENQPVSAFITRQQEEQAKNVLENRTAEEEHMPIWAILCIFIIIISVIIVIAS